MSIFEGSAVALVTPFTQEGIHFDALKRLLDFQLDNGTDALVICGTTGEPATMTVEEKHAVMQTAIQHVAGRRPVILGTGGNNTAAVIRESKYAEDLGADALLIVTPYYNKCSQEGLLRHYFAIAEQTALPIILYNVPGRTGCSISPACCARLAAHPNIAGIKEASGNIGYTARIAKLVGDDFCLFSGNDDMIVPIMSLGGCGVISVWANICPKEVHALTSAFASGEIAKAREIQLKYLELIDALFCEVNPIPVKEAMNQMGMEVGGYRLPLCEISPAGRERVHRALEVLR